MQRRINVIDFETGKSVNITVDDEESVDALLQRVKNYWLKEGDYILLHGDEMLMPLNRIKDYDIRQEEILKLQTRASLGKKERKRPAPRRPEGIVYPERCPNCGPVQFRYLSATQFQCTVCGGVLQKQARTNYDDPLASFLPQGSSFMGQFRQEEAQKEQSSEEDLYGTQRTNVPQYQWQGSETPGEYDQPSGPARGYEQPSNATGEYDEPADTSGTPPPRIVPDSEDEGADKGPEGETSEPFSFRSSPRIVRSEGDMSESLKSELLPGENKEMPLLEPVSPSPDVPVCENCGEGMRFIEVYGMWWCDKCEKYLGEDIRDIEEGREGRDGEAFEGEGADPTALNISGEGEIEDALVAIEPGGAGTDKEIEELLIDQGRNWLEEIMKMDAPTATRHKWEGDDLRVEYTDEGDRVCVLEIDSKGENIKPLYYSSSVHVTEGEEGRFF